MHNFISGQKQFCDLLITPTKIFENGIDERFYSIETILKPFFIGSVRNEITRGTTRFIIVIIRLPVHLSLALITHL